MKNVKMPFYRYHQYPRVSPAERQRPDCRITKAPVWRSIDLRDGNQALSIPMNVEAKIMMFEL